MFDPPSFPQSGSYLDLRKRLMQRMQLAKVDDRILEAVATLFEKNLNTENIVLSRAEKQHLFGEITKMVLTEMLAKLDGAK
jgi:hypothetical protein